MPIIKTNNINLYYETYGQGQPLIFISGFSGDHTAWQTVIHNYADHYQVIILDNRGIGKTDCPTYPYTTEMFADDIAGLVNALQIGPVHFIGHSYGGCIVQNIAYKYPELTKSIVLVCTTPKLNIRCKLYTEARLELIKADAPETSIMKFITLLCWSKKHLNEPNMVETMIQGDFYPITITGYENQMHAALTFDSRSWLNQIKCPCLVLAGDDDILATVKDGEYLSQKIPHAEFYCFKDVGHVPHCEQPDIFNSLVHSFLNKYNKH
jgi:3-oxoadipate enol-lactonase